MSQHPSLKTSSVSAEQRTVLRRYEKVKALQEKKQWNEKTSIFHLPKVKTMRLKVKKAASEAAPKEGAPAGTTPAAATGAAAATKKPAAGPSSAAASAKPSK